MENYPTNQTTHIQDCNSSIRKSQLKTNSMLETANCVYEKTKAIRPLFLKITRMYDDIKDEWVYTEFCQVAYIKACEMIPTINTEIKALECNLKENEKKVKYLKTFKNNLKKMKKLCEDTSITYYSMLPDCMCLDLRTHCVQFISQATI